MKIKPCPKNCAFDWPAFHRNLDIALAHMINESTENGAFPMLPSSTSVLDFITYSGLKAQAQKGDEKN